MKQPACVLVVIEFIEVGHAELYLFGKAGKYTCQVLLLIRPVSGCQYLNLELTSELLKKRGNLELLHRILAHFDIFEHNLDLLSELKATFLLELKDHVPLSVFQEDGATCTTVVEEALAEAVLVEALEDILVLDVAEDLDHSFKPVVDFSLGQSLEILLKLVVQVVDETHGCLFALLVEEGFKSSLDGQVDVHILSEAALVNTHHLFSQIDHVSHEFIMLELFISHELGALLNDIERELLGKGGESILDFGEELIHQGELIILLVLYHRNHTRILHHNQGLCMILYVFFHEGGNQ